MQFVIQLPADSEFDHKEFTTPLIPKFFASYWKHEKIKNNENNDDNNKLQIQSMGRNIPGL